MTRKTPSTTPSTPAPRPSESDLASLAQQCLELAERCASDSTMQEDQVREARQATEQVVKLLLENLPANTTTAPPLKRSDKIAMGHSYIAELEQEEEPTIVRLILLAHG